MALDLSQPNAPQARPVLQRQVPPEVLAKFRKHERDQRDRERLYGKVRDIISTEFNGRRVIAVGNELHHSPAWRTFPDFLLYYLRKIVTDVFGAAWFNQQAQLAEERRHPIALWLEGWYAFTQRNTVDVDGIFSGVPDGPAAACINLAYDLYTVRNQVGLQVTVLKRLQHIPNFQGARYELQVTATMCRAGFSVEFEDDSDVSRSHPEFIASDPETGSRFAVEAKSRRRPGVLGEPHRVQASEVIQLGITRLFKSALGKRPELPFLIFIDLNLPPDLAARLEEWRGEFDHMLATQIDGKNANGEVVGVPFAALFLTNLPHHYGLPGEKDPPKLGLTTVPIYPERGLPQSVIDRIEAALSQYGNIPSVLPSQDE